MNKKRANKVNVKNAAVAEPVCREPPLDSQGNPFPHPVDSEDMEFYAWLDTAAQGDVMSVHNLLCQCFNQMKKAKDDLILAMRKGTLPDNKHKESVATAQQMYAHLQRLETRIFKCRDRLSAIRSKPLSDSTGPSKQET